MDQKKDKEFHNMIYNKLETIVRKYLSFDEYKILLHEYDDDIDVATDSLSVYVYDIFKTIYISNHEKDLQIFFSFNHDLSNRLLSAFVGYVLSMKVIKIQQNLCNFFINKDLSP